MGLLNQSHSIFKTASPIFVHLLMIVGVALYTLMGAVVMQRLETKTVLRNRRMTSEVTTVADGNQTTSDLYNQLNTTDLSLNINLTSINFEQKPKQKREIAQFTRSRKCVFRAIKKLMDMDCDANILNRMTIKMIENCYHVTVRNERSLEDVVFKGSGNAKQVGMLTSGFIHEDLAGDQRVYIEPWTFSDAILFSFTIITASSYFVERQSVMVSKQIENVTSKFKGNIAPQSFGGRAFCIVYGFIGIPFTLLAIADLGRFFSEMIDSGKMAGRKAYKRIRRRFRIYYRAGGAESMLSVASGKSSRRTDANIENGELASNFGEIEKLNDNEVEDTEEKKSEDDEELEPISNALPLMAIFLLYSLLGALLLSSYEEMTFFKLIYLLSVSTFLLLRLGDVIPKSEAFMGLTLLYIAVGLALTTIAIDIAADYLKRLHYYGRKIENVGGVVIWFGSKTLTVKQLVKNLGDQFNLPVTTMKTLDLDLFVDNAIKVESGELETLRPPPLEPSDVMLDSPVTFADDKEPWLPMKTPSLRTPSPQPDPTPREPSPTPREPTPEIREPTPPPEEPVVEERPESPLEAPKETTEDELLAMKRRSYSEEAWRRYQQYQKQWRKFRQTQPQFAGPSGRRRSSAANSQTSGSQRNVTTSAASGTLDSTTSSTDPSKQ
ncbi:Ion channel [Aphelenchoides besseyi]|nr:Ion channel [Aphelenchoides besseyi]